MENKIPEITRRKRPTSRAVPVSIPLDDYAILSAQAKNIGMGLATYLKALLYQRINDGGVLLPDKERK